MDCSITSCLTHIKTYVSLYPSFWMQWLPLFRLPFSPFRVYIVPSACIAAFKALMKALILELTKVDSIQQDVLSRHAGHHLRREHKPFLKHNELLCSVEMDLFTSHHGIQVLLRWELTNFNDPHAKTMNGPVEGHVSYWYRSRQISFFAIGQRGVVYTSKPFSF